MDCRNCREPMITAELEEVEIDFCHTCGGIWLDAGELESLFSVPNAGRKLLASFMDAPEFPEKGRFCPICRKKMNKIHAGADENVVILDRCPAGHGLWFDRGELGQILKFGKIDPDGKVIKILKEIFGDK